MIQDLGIYKSFQELSNDLVYMHRTSKSFIIYMGPKKDIKIQMKFNRVTKYQYSIDIEDPNLKAFFEVSGINPVRLKLSNKTAFLNRLQADIESLIKYLQSKNYKMFFTPEVNLFDLENIDADFGLEGMYEAEVEEDEGQKLFNKVILFHNIPNYNIAYSGKRDNVYVVEVNSLQMNICQLFPQEDSYLKDISLDVKGIPNVYFPGLVSIEITKSFSYRDIQCVVEYKGQDLIQNYASITKQYFGHYKRNPQKDAPLSFATKLLAILKNPFQEENFKNIQIDSISQKSQCKKCGSTSGMFKIVFSMVDIQTEMWAFAAKPLLVSNIKNHKEILQVKCLECDNEILKDTKKFLEIEERRDEIWTEDWRDPDTKIPILDNREETSVTVRYDTMELEVEFDQTNPVLPKMIQSKIIGVWRVVGWRDFKTGIYKSFYMS